LHNTNATQARGKRETDNQPPYIAILYPLENNRPAGMSMSSKCKRCHEELRERKAYSDHYQKGTSRPDNVDIEDNVNYYKSTYPSFTADDKNRINFEFPMDNGNMQDVQVIAIPQAIDNNFNTNIPKSLASCIEQASKSQKVLQEENGVQQLMTVGTGYHIGSNGFNKQLMNSGKESELNKYRFGTPSNDEIGYIHTEHLNELNTNMNTQTYSHLLSDISVSPSLQYGLLRSGNTQEYYRPYDNTELLSQKLDERGNSPLEESMHSKSTLPRNDLYTDKNFPQQTTYNSHQYDNARTMDSDTYKNRHENIYSKHEEENEYQDVYNTYTRCSQINPGLMHNIAPVTNYEIQPTGHSSEHTLKTPTGTREDITHNHVMSDILLYPSSDNRRLMQGTFVSQNGLTSLPYVQGNPWLKHHTMPVANSELPPIGYTSEYTLDKPTGTSDDITHNKEVSDTLFYSSNDNRRLTQSKFVPPDGLTSSPYVQEPRSNMQRYYPGKPSAVQNIPNAQQKAALQVQNIQDAQEEDGLLVQTIQDAQEEDGLLGQSIPDAQQKDGSLVQGTPNAQATEASTCCNEISDLSSHVFKFLTSQDGMWKKDSRLTTANSMLPLPTANIRPSMSHLPYHYRNLKEVLNNMDSPKLNIIAPKHDDYAASHYFIQKNKIPSHQLPYVKEINELNEGLQFMQNRENTPPLPYIKEINEQNEGLHFMQNGDNTSPHNCKASAITNVPKRTELMADHSKYTQWVANTSPNRDETPRYLSSTDGRNTVPTNLPFQIPTYNMIEIDDNLPLPQKPVASQYEQKISTPSKNRNVESVVLQSQSPTSIIQLQLAHHKPSNYRLTEGTNNMQFSISEKDKCGASTVISEITDKSKCTSSTAIPSQNKDRGEILWVPEEMRSVSSSVNDDSYFVPRSDSLEVEPSLKPSTVSGRTKHKFSHMFQNTTNDSHYLPASVMTSLEHARLSPTPSSSINVQARSKSEDTFRQTVNTPVLQYPAELKASLMETYSAVTFPPLVTTVTTGTYLPETYTEMPIMDDYKTKTIVRQDIIPTLQLNGDYETTRYSVTKIITSEENMNDVSNSTTELTHGFKQKSSDKTTDFSESFQYDISTAIAEKEMKEKWNVESEQSTSVMPNLYEVYEIQDVAHPTTNAITMAAITDDATEQVATDLLNDKFKIQLGPIPGNTRHQPIMTAKVTQQQDTYYSPSTTMTELLTEKPYNYASDVAYITYVTAKRQDDHSSMASTAASSDDKETNPEGLVVPDKRASSENEGNYYLSTATALLPENTTNIVYMNTQPPESLESTHKESLNQFYTATVTPQAIEVEGTTEKRIKITDTAVSKKAIKYKEKVSTYLTADKPIITVNAGHSRKQVIFESGMDKLDKTTMTDKFPQNYKEQISAQKDTHKTLKMKTTEKYRSPGTMTSETSQAAQQTYQTALHILNKTNTHASTVSEKTTFQTIAINSEIMNGISETSFPTERSDISQSVYFTTPYETEDDDRSTADLHKPNNDNSWILKDGLQYLHTDNYGTSQNAIFTKTPYANYNKDKIRSTLNAAVGGWNQKDAQDVAINQHRTYFHDRDMLQELTTTSEGSDDTDDLDALYFIIPTLPPQQNKVRNNYIQLRETKLEKNTGQLPELQNIQDEQCRTGVTSSLPKVQNDTEEQKLLLHHAEFRSENLNTDILCNDTANSQSRDIAEYQQNDGSGIVKQFSYDTKRVSSEHIQLRNSITDSMEVPRPDNTGDILSEYKIPEDKTTTVTDNELPDTITDNWPEYKQTDVTRVYTENRQTGGQHAEHKYPEKEPASLIKYQQPERMTGAMQGYTADDPLRVIADHKQPKHELPTQYGTDNQGVLQSQVVTEQTGIPQDELKRTEYTKNYDTNAVKQSDEDVTNETNDFKKALMSLLQKNDKLKLLLDSPNSDTTSVPSAPTGIDGQSHLSKEPDTEDQGQTEALKLASSKLTPANLVYNSIEMSNADGELLKNIIMGTNKSKDLPPVSLPEKKRQTKSSQDIHTATSEKCKIIHTSQGKHNLKYQDKLQQPSISKKEYSSAFQVPSLKVGKSENTYKINTKPKQNSKLKAGVTRSNDVSDTAISLAHQPQMSDMRTQRSTCGPWTWYKNYFCMPAASPELNDHLLLSDNEHINTVPTSIYEMNINGEPKYDYEMDSSLESDKTAQDLFLNFHKQQPNINTNFQHSDTLSEEKIMMKNTIHNNHEENQSLHDDSMTDIYVLDSPQLLRFHMYKDKTDLQPKLYTKRRSNSYHNTQNIPEENYEQVIQNSIVATRPVFLGNWKKYHGLLEEITQPNPSAFETHNYNNPHTQHLSYMNNNEENARALLVFKKREVNQESYDDNNEEITYSKSGRKRCHQPCEQEILKQRVSQSSSFGKVHDESKDHSEHEDNSEEFIKHTSSERDLKNVNDDYIIHTFVSDVSHDNIFNQHNNYYKKKVLSESMQKIPQNQYKYSNDCIYSILYHNPSVKDNNKQNNVIRCLLNNNNIFHQPEDNYNLQHVKVYSSDDDDETNEHHSNNVVRRMRHAMQYPTGSFKEREKEVHPKYESTSCQSYNCEGVLTSEIKTVTSILKWLKKIITDTKKT
jgi:hypothetical protein